LTAGRAACLLAALVKRLRPSAVVSRLLLAAVALLAGLDLHALDAHGSVPHAPDVQEAAHDGRVDLHGHDCSHREHLPPAHHAHGCVLCKAGPARGDTLAPLAAAVQAAPRPEGVARGAAVVLRTGCAGGVLGARGPPGPAT